MSLAAMVLADRVPVFMRFYDPWMRFITGGRDALLRAAALRSVQPNDRLLDVGCGTGSLAIAAALHGARVVGIDHSRPMLDLARENAVRAGASVEFREGRLPILALAGEPFDVVTATFVLSELSPDEAALAVRALAEAVRPGGRIIIADEALPYAPALRFFSALQRVLFALLAFALLQELAPTHRHPLRRLLEAAGLTIRQDITFQRGALRLVVAERPATLLPMRRLTRPLDTALPRGVVRSVLRVAAWFALPIPVAPGVYRVGTPNAESPVLLTGNFLASVEALRRALAGRDGYLIVTDTSGWNVWCASDARLFTAEKATALIRFYDVERLVSHRRIVIPRLGGRIRTHLAALTRWEVVTGPIEARDLPAYLDGGAVTPAMRSLDRMYRLPERLRVCALTMAQLPLLLLPFRLLPKPVRRAALRYALVASWILPLFHYQLPGRTGIVKSGVLGGAVSVILLTSGRRYRAQAVAVLLSAPYIGWIYQSSSPVIYWKRLWK
jgi:2-polyprenyl-3-methyl-5-hydroxy-6-metoxy-1,4-benzoquinol methylase